jgi:hypothetical protein
VEYPFFRGRERLSRRHLLGVHALPEQAFVGLAGAHHDPAAAADEHGPGLRQIESAHRTGGVMTGEAVPGEQRRGAGRKLPGGSRSVRDLRRFFVIGF